MDAKENIEIVQIKSTLERILDHQVEFKNSFKLTNGKIDGLHERINSEEKRRLEHVQSIKDEIHGRINMILFSILGGAGLFITGVIMFVLERKP